ncbi:hypothetical protein J6590_093226 [Homalodisca vitripennis]|nr:hypothetical protein J6590_093226 [Homalodisca vitripennis]
MSCIIEHLLEVVYTYPVLYDLNHKDYKNIRKKDKIWEDIGKTLNTSGDEMKKKWKNMRDCYMKYLRDCKTTTGQAKRNYKKWTWATQLERFKPFIGMAKTMSNVTAPEIEGDNTNSDEFVDEPDELVDDGGDNQEMPARREMSIQEEPINMNLVRNYPTRLVHLNQLQIFFFFF